MQAIVLHKPGVKIGPLKKGLRRENIELVSKTYYASSSINAEVLSTNLLIIFLDGVPSELVTLIPEIRRKKYTLPIATLDSSEHIENKKLASAHGADTYISFPVSFRTLAFKLKNALCKKAAQNACRWMRAWDVWLDMERRLVKRDDRVIPLRNKEFALLEYFIINRGKLLTRNAILEYVWDRNANFASNTVDVHINRLRRKLDLPFRQKLIHTVHCLGYIFDKYHKK